MLNIWKIWRALFSCHHRLENRPFCLITGDLFFSTSFYSQLSKTFLTSMSACHTRLELSHTIGNKNIIATLQV